MSECAGRRIAGYELERELGEGGMGTLYVASLPVLQRPAVLKVLREALAGDPVQEERFLREAQSAARIHHPNVVAVYDCFAHRGALYLAQEYVDGLDLASLLVRAGPLPPRIAAQLALEVARGLEEIHAQGIVHRDLKPANVLLSRRGEVKIADFGIALPDQGPALTRVGCAIGTAPYMSPEQLLGDRVDDRSDSFAFGLLLYELVTASRPFAADDAEPEASLLRAIQRGRYARLRRRAPGTPRRLAWLVRRCLRARPARRPSARQIRLALERCVPAPEAAECRASLARWLEQRGVLQAPEDPAATRVRAATPPRRPPRRWVRVAQAAAIALSVLAVGAVRSRPVAPPPEAAAAAPVDPAACPGSPPAERRAAPAEREVERARAQAQPSRTAAKRSAPKTRQTARPARTATRSAEPGRTSGRSRTRDRR